MNDGADTLLSRFRKWLGKVRRYDTYIYNRRTYHLPKDKCENLRRSAALANSLMQMYLVKHQQGGARAQGFHRDVQCANLMVLKEFDRVCQKHNLTYMLYGGTLLGAYRHGGFIPWDDDIDVIMPREQYEKIIDVFNAESANPSLLAKLVSPSRGVVFTKIEAVGEPMIFIDILPYDCYAGTLDRSPYQCNRELNQRIISRVLPDKNPEATYKWYASLRNNMGFGLTPVRDGDPECRIVVAPADCGGQHFFDAADMFPPADMDFGGLSMPVPAHPEAILEGNVLFGKSYMQLPTNIRSHSRSNKLTTTRMLNIKRFLRGDPLRHPPVPMHNRADSKENLRDRLVTLLRKAISPAFIAITRDTVKEYRIFSSTVFRLRADRVIRGHLEAVESYSRLIQDVREHPHEPDEIRQKQLATKEVLAQVLRVCESGGLTVWLWSIRLLDVIRYGEFSKYTTAGLLMPRADYERFLSVFNTASAVNGIQAKLGEKLGGVAILVIGDAMKEGGVSIFPCDSCPDDWDRNLYAKEMAKPENKAKVAEFTAQKDMDGLYRHFADLRERMGIGLESDKNHSIFPAFDCPHMFEQCCVLPAKYYMPSGKAMFEGLEVPVPADPDMILTSLYGDWLYYNA